MYTIMWTCSPVPITVLIKRFSCTLPVGERKGPHLTYCKIPTIRPGLIFVQKAFLLGLFSGELIFGGAYYWREFCV